MFDYRDILVNVSPIILTILFFIFTKSLYDGIRLVYTLSACLMFAFNIYITSLILGGYGHDFPAVLILVIWILVFICIIIITIKEKSNIISKILYILFFINSSILCLDYILYRLTDREISDYIYDILGLDYAKFFESIIENDWFKGISIGIIGTVCGGLILDKIKNRNKEE